MRTVCVFTTVVVPCTVKTPGRAAVLAKHFFEVIRKMPKGAVSIAASNAECKVQYGDGKGWSRFPVQIADEFPRVPELKGNLRMTLAGDALILATGSSPRALPGLPFDGVRVLSSDHVLERTEIPESAIIIGGGGPRRTPRLAAAYAAEFNMPFASVADTAAQLARVDAACEAAGRDPASLVRSAAQVVCCAATPAELVRRASAIGRDVDELAEHGLCGTPSQVVDKLAAFAAAGCARAYLQVLDLADLEHLALLGEEVLPDVRPL